VVYNAQLIHRWDATEVGLEMEEVLNDEDFLSLLDEEYQQWVAAHEEMHNVD